MGDLGRSILHPLRRLEWCLQTTRRPALWGNAEEWTLSLRPARLYADHHGTPARCRLLPAALGLRPRRVSQRTWEEVQVRAWTRVTPPRRTPRQEASGWTACGPDPISNKAKMPPGGAALTVKNSLQTAGDHPQPLAPSATPGCYTTGSRFETALDPVPIVPRN